ncbi:hypothetical protein ElyMa_001966300 [Elysia marginata]|uniref:Uncharacterized protein n=1 Tax=Elysia marginata TaxID=1093978 RepID=A0AAV4F0J6_9GAST|nr:hypothetical protein ElyMa_001966300 [Elysia marginata]
MPTTTKYLCPAYLKLSSHIICTDKDDGVALVWYEKRLVVTRLYDCRRNNAYAFSLIDEVIPGHKNEISAGELLWHWPLLTVEDIAAQCGKGAILCGLSLEPRHRN